MKQVVLGTAGHIDHGKTSLIKALTGISTDRLKEEKERGITIELGFAHLSLPSGQRLGIVDVPGHEKFVKNMVAGATGIDLVSLVVAADEGVMPQTREHLEICQVLDVKFGLVILTKIDMVDSDWLELVREDLNEYLSDTFLAGAPVVEVSAITGQGIDDLVKVLDRLVQEIPERGRGHIFRLPVDRVFTMKGFGTVVTGTSVSGHIGIADEITVYPQGYSARIRGIQIHGEESKAADSGLRTAINLQGVEKAAIQRGNVIATKDSLQPTYMVDTMLYYLPSAARKLKNRAKARFHTGTSEIISTVVLLDREELAPGDSCYAQIRLDEPTAVLRNDRYVLRSYSPVRTIGGGEILNALPNKKKRFSDRVLEEMKILHRGELSEVIELFISLSRFSGMEQASLPFLVNMGKKRLDEELHSLKAQKRIVQYGKNPNILIHSDFYQQAENEISNTLLNYHKDNPLKVGLLKEELRSRTVGAKNQKLFGCLIERLTKEGRIVQDKEVVRLKDHSVTLKEDQQQARRKLEEIYLKGGLTPPYFSEVNEKLLKGVGADILEVMVKEGVIVKIKEDLYFHHRAVKDLEKRLVDFLKKNGEITTPQIKDMTGVSRKYTIPLIEYFDKTQVTVRVGDSRVLRNR
ncbi:MAG: selenocysteine-specific translation elongation factor [Desulfatiglans sp.]|jgi:selenocysteine-specific elongation factor|nr:selenocysteine-specific translation elongation factor [Thermodesulfobacteriota bacterium]MEE4351860.1 selenocysteine-specific translation elongation factor [Desulfatiglans sp.]